MTSIVRGHVRGHVRGAVTRAARASVSSALLALALAAQPLAPQPLGAQTLPSRLREVVYQHAPLILAETWNEEVNPEATDHLLPVDFDCDQLGANNARNAYNPASFCDGRPAVYFSIVETGSTSGTGYYFIGYYFYHPNQPRGSFPTPLGTYTTEVHQHDFEGVWFVVQKSPYTPYGTLVGALTQAHGALIPFGRLTSGGTGLLYRATAGVAGYINFWTHRRSGVKRPVVAIRSRVHGTFMAQDYTNQSIWGLHNGFGVHPRSPELYGAYYVTVHRGTQPIVYEPVPLVSPSPTDVARRLGVSTRRGVWKYRLVELARSPIWLQRNAAGALLTGPSLYLGGGRTGLSAFAPSVGAVAKAKPAWNWLGGRGERRRILGDVAHWYTFGVDMSSRYFSSAWWPTTSPGRLLTAPAAEAGLRFVGLPNLNAPVRYNPYLARITPGSKP